MEFAGNDYIYLSKLKKDKIKKIRESEEDNKEEAPIPSKVSNKYIEKDEISKKLKKYENKKVQRKGSNISDDSDDAYLQVNSNNFNIDLNSNMNMNYDMNQEEQHGKVFKKAIDTNVCVIRYITLEQQSEGVLPKLFKCEKCESYLNIYSKLIPKKDNKYEWKCEFCSNINRNILIDKNNIPNKETIENCIEPQIIKETNKDDESSLIFCFDKSGSMCQSYNVGKEVKEKFDKISGKKASLKSQNQKYENKNNDYNNKYDDDNDNDNDYDNDYNEEEDDNIDFTNYDFNKNNTNYISRLDMVKLSIESNIKSLLKNSPNVKVGIVSFGNEIEVKGDCLSNVMIIKEKDMNNESKIKSLGEENTNLIKAPIKLSSESIIKSLRATEENGSTALGPAILLSLSLLKKAKIGSRIFLCTDGMSNLGIGDISENREKAIEFYKKIGNMAKEKGIVISLITFEDSESEIDVLKNMIEYSGGEIIRVNPNEILDGFNDLLENQVIASGVEIKMNLNKCMTFRDQDIIDLKNDESSLVKKIGNATRETETYYELKFKHAEKLAEMKDINFDELKNLIFQVEISFKKKDGAKYIRVITKNLKVSDNKEEINKQANLNIVSTNQIQKSAKLAGDGNLMDAQAQIHIARNFLSYNKNINSKNKHIYKQFNCNMNRFHDNLNNMNMMNNYYREEDNDDMEELNDYNVKNNDDMEELNYKNNNMNNDVYINYKNNNMNNLNTMNRMNYNKNNMNRMNNNKINVNNMNRKNNNKNYINKLNNNKDNVNKLNNNKKTINNLNNNNFMNNYMNNNMNRMNNNNKNSTNNYRNNINMNKVNKTNKNNNMNNFNNYNNFNMNNMKNNNDDFSGQIFQLAHTSENRQNNYYNRNIKK